MLRRASCLFNQNRLLGSPLTFWPTTRSLHSSSIIKGRFDSLLVHGYSRPVVLSSASRLHLRHLPLPVALFRSSIFRRQSGPPLLINFSIVSARGFHRTQPRQDVFFVAFPALKAQLLALTRFTLVLLPFVWRYRYVSHHSWLLPGLIRVTTRIWRKYPRWSFALLQIPVIPSHILAIHK
jgi:hypothetical protein